MAEEIQTHVLSLRATAVSCIRTVLLRLVRLAIKYGLQWEDFKEISRKLYIKGAIEELKKRGFSVPAKTQIQALTGIYRKKIKLDDALTEDHFKHPFNDLVSEWMTNPRYCENRKPKSLPTRAIGVPSFEELSKKHFKDLPHKAVLEQLEVSGNVKVEESSVRLIDNFFAPYTNSNRGIDDHEKHLRSAMHAASNLLMTATRNIDSLYAGQRPALTQIQYWADHVTKEQLSSIRSKLNEIVREVVRKGSSVCDEYDGPDDPFDATYKVGLGAYVFETPIAATSS